MDTSSSSKSQAEQNNELAQLNSTSRKKKEKILLKAPTQERSKQTVYTILEACRKILISEGFFGVTTDKVAKEAQVSIGSLYQFFGNKESVVSAVVQEMYRSDYEYISTIMEKVDLALPVETKIHIFVETFILTYAKNLHVRSKLQNMQNYLTDENFYKNTRIAYEKLFIQLLGQTPASRETHLVAKIAISALLGVLDQSLPELENLRASKDFQVELTHLLVSFVK